MLLKGLPIAVVSSVPDEATAMHQYLLRAGADVLLFVSIDELDQEVAHPSVVVFLADEEAPTPFCFAAADYCTRQPSASVIVLANNLRGLPRYSTLAAHE